MRGTTLRSKVSAEFIQLYVVLFIFQFVQNTSPFVIIYKLYFCFLNYLANELHIRHNLLQTRINDQRFGIDKLQREKWGAALRKLCPWRPIHTPFPSTPLPPVYLCWFWLMILFNTIFYLFTPKSCRLSYYPMNF